MWYCACFVWSSSYSCKHFLVQEAGCVFWGPWTWGRAQGCWRIKLIRTAVKQLSLLRCLASRGIQGHYSGKGLVTKEQFWAWWSQGMRFDNLSFISWVSARAQQHSNSSFGLFLTFLGFLSKENIIGVRDLLHFNTELHCYMIE